MTLFAGVGDHEPLQVTLVLVCCYLPVVFVAGWVGHACIWTAALNHLYGRAIPKWFLKLYRLASGVVIVSFPALLLVASWPPAVAYVLGCTAFGLMVFPAITAYRLLNPRPAAVLAEHTETIDFGRRLGRAAVGDGKYSWVARLPFNDAFRVDFTHLTLAVPRLPPAWDGLTVLLLSDLHFHGTPSRKFFDAVFDKLAAEPTPDLVVLAGDYVDTDEHHAWVEPLLGRLSATEGKVAILGNHDKNHDPTRLRDELARAGYTILSNRWATATVRGVEVLLCGHEGPWFRPPPDLTGAPDVFRVCVAHTPDQFYWGRRNGIDLMLCGHVHGGQIRVPVVGSIFVPSVYGRRFDQGVFEGGGTVMVVGRGLSGKEPLRFRCRPQVLRLTLRPGGG